ncbi:MAG: uroporphyrinogen decarboxylase [Alphaproteobacteria bacterium]|nr:uroporphyrinogen decarboxylase [Alphaproteobacteria bacterium]
MKPLLAALGGERTTPVPFWFMRQAGRYLPEYRQIRAQAGGFLDLCFNPVLATEVTLQPVRRFGMDAAILFSDILVVPLGLGIGVRFEEGEGPKLDRLETLDHLPPLEPKNFLAKLAPVYETVARVAVELKPETALIGFAGGPWTVATYMVEGGSSREFVRTKAWAYGNPRGFSRLIELLISATVEHLSGQIQAGAEVVQLFDSWAGALSEEQFARWSIEPIRLITAALKCRHPTVPIIAFPRGAGANYLSFAEKAGVEAIGLDTTVPIDWAARELQPKWVVQGNLDPQLVVIGGQPMLNEAKRILQGLTKGPLIFNLGHGVVPETPPENIGVLCQFIRDFRREAV